MTFTSFLADCTCQKRWIAGIALGMMAPLVVMPVFLHEARGQNAPSEPVVQIDLVLIVDTSHTMAGKAGGQNVFPDVKKVLKELVDACNAGDNVVLISYSATATSQPTALIYDRQDKLAIHRQIDALVAEGDWTYTALAIQRGLAEAKRLDDAQGADKHTKVVVLLTDGLNNPPRQIRGTSAEVLLDDVTRHMQGMPWFVWQIQLGPRIDEGVDKAFRDAGFQNYQPVKTAREQLDRVRADISRRIETEKARRLAENAESERIKKALEDKARREAEDLRKAEELALRQRVQAQQQTPDLPAETPRRWLRIAGALAALVALVGMAILIHKLRSVPRLQGKLAYWKPPEKAKAPLELETTGKRSMRIGDGPDFDLSLPGFGEAVLELRMRRIEGEDVCFVEAGKRGTLTFNGSSVVTPIEIYNDDGFEVGAYRFQYHGGLRPRKD